MPRVAVDFRTASRENYIDFCKSHPSSKISFDKWKNIIYTFNESFRNYILETGDKAKFPYGFGDFSILKRKRNKFKIVDGKEIIDLPIDWPKSRQKHKLIYNMNDHTEGFSFKWLWFKETSRIKYHDLWYFKPSRVTSRLLAHYIKVSDKYQHMYKEWKSVSTNKYK